MSEASIAICRCALAIAHPGHEIRVFGWMTEHQPLVSVLTDGSGRTNNPRLASTAVIVRQTGSRVASQFGLTTDQSLYAEVLAGNAGIFLRIADRLARDWVEHDIELVVGDAREGGIMAHDLWRGVIDQAIHLTESRTGRSIRNLAFSLECDPRQAPENHPLVALHGQLDDSLWQRKLRAAGNYRGLEHEVRFALDAWGREAFRHELLLETSAADPPAGSDTPAYERHGERQVQAGVYQRVVRYQEHVWPILESLRAGRPAA